MTSPPLASSLLPLLWSTQPHQTHSSSPWGISYLFQTWTDPCAKTCLSFPVLPFDFINTTLPYKHDLDCTQTITATAAVPLPGWTRTSAQSLKWGTSGKTLHGKKHELLGRRFLGNSFLSQLESFGWGISHKFLTGNSVLLWCFFYFSQWQSSYQEGGPEPEKKACLHPHSSESYPHKELWACWP